MQRRTILEVIGLPKEDPCRELALRVEDVTELGWDSVDCNWNENDLSEYPSCCLK